jgi:hypothetical protein
MNGVKRMVLVKATRPGQPQTNNNILRGKIKGKISIPIARIDKNGTYLD